MAYKDPKRRTMWLRVWCKEVEKAEEDYIDELEELNYSAGNKFHVFGCDESTSQH